MPNLPEYKSYVMGYTEYDLRASWDDQTVDRFMEFVKDRTVAVSDADGTVVYYAWDVEEFTQKDPAYDA